MKKPNILFILPDQHRSDWIGGNNHLPLRTPNLDRLRAVGMHFRNAVSPSPLCAPARACLASGRDYTHCGVAGNEDNFPLDIPTYYQRLRDAGYRVCGVGKFDLHKDLASGVANLDWHLDGSRSLAAWGFTEGIDNEGKLDGTASYSAAGRPKGPYMKHLHDAGLADRYVQEHNVREKFCDAYISCLPDEYYCDNWIAENGLQFLRNFPDDQPWHLVVNFTGPHDPMEVTQSMHDAWKDTKFSPPVHNDQPNFSDEDHQRSRQHYAAMIENIDRQVGRFIEAVRERGELENTLIVYSSDHGEMLGDHNRWGKGTWRHPSMAIPLIVAGPGIPHGTTSEALVSLHDLAATYIDYAEASPLPEMDAQSMKPILEQKSDTHRPYVHSAWKHWRAVFDGRYKLVLEKEQPPQLYDLKRDPTESQNIAETHPDIVKRMIPLG